MTSCGRLESRSLTLMALPPGCGAVIGFGAAREVSLVRVQAPGGER